MTFSFLISDHWEVKLTTPLRNLGVFVVVNVSKVLLIVMGQDKMTWEWFSVGVGPQIYRITMAMESGSWSNQATAS